MQEWNEIQFNGVYYNPSKKGKPGELPAADTSYTFRYPRPDRYAPNHSADSPFVVLCNWCLDSQHEMLIGERHFVDAAFAHAHSGYRACATMTLSVMTHT